MKSPDQLIRLAEGYSRYLSEPGADAYLAWGRVGQVIRSLPPPQAFNLACHIVRSLPGAYLQRFGGGTLAHLIHHHGATVIDWIEREAWRDVDFLEALSSAWIARDDLPPPLLARLRIATGSGIHIVSLSERDATYTTTFANWRTRRPRRLARRRTKSSRAHDYAVESAAELAAHTAVTSISPRAAPQAPNGLPEEKGLWWLQFMVPLVRFQVYIATRPPLVRYLAQGVFIVWLCWAVVTTMMAPLLLPTLLVALFITSMSPVFDLMLIVGAFALATAAAALVSLAIGVGSQRRAQPSNAPMYISVMSLIPYLTIIVLLARTEHGVIVAPAVLAGVVFGSFAMRFFRRARAGLRHAPVKG